jgi:hypothetical protein
MNVRFISSHAVEQYCLRKYNDISLYLKFPEKILIEIRSDLEGAVTSFYSPRQFFNGNHSKGIQARDVTLLENKGLLFPIREEVLLTILSVPGEDKISDFFISLKNS